jgi:hypothetical protein
MLTTRKKMLTKKCSQNFQKMLMKKILTAVQKVINKKIKRSRRVGIWWT